MLSAVSGECYTLGSNQFGQLGVSSSEPRSDHVAGQSGQLGPGSPSDHVVIVSGGGSCHRVSRLERHVVTHVACGDSFTVAVTKRTYVCLSVCLPVFCPSAKGRQPSGTVLHSSCEPCELSGALKMEDWKMDPFSTLRD